LQFTRLNLTGFKSFVDRTELAIEPGMTGIVGPNGCGKSNLVEALRWVMGENSAKRMRGGEMDDIIFGGTSTRPARNLAEVSLLVDNEGQEIPLPFAAGPEIEIMRRIERGEGSDFRINGSQVRARDVQLLFADAATGAHSTALVSQGRIGAIINAKPVERRSLLEEAADLLGLGPRHFFEVFVPEQLLRAVTTRPGRELGRVLLAVHLRGVESEGVRPDLGALRRERKRAAASRNDAGRSL